jgi:hypothetical protein
LISKCVDLRFDIEVFYSISKFLKNLTTSISKSVNFDII